MTYPRSSPGVLPTVSGRKSFQQNRSLERSFGQRLDSSGDRVGLQTPLGGYPGSSQVDPAILQTSFFTGSLSGSGAGNFSHVDEGGYRGNFVPGCIPGLLRPLVLRPEGIRWSSPGFGFVSSECFSEKNSFSHGDRFVRPFGHPARGLGDSDRSQGRLFPRPDSSSVSQMAQIHLERQNFPIQGSSLWAQPGPLGVYSDRPGSLHCGSFKGYSSGSIPRRLDDFSGQPVSQQRALYGGRQPSSDARLHPERQEVFPHPFPNIHVPGNEVRHCINVGTSYPRENRTVCFSPRPIALPSAYNGTIVSCSSRPNRVPGSIGPPRPCPQKGIATTIQEQVAPGKTALGRSGPSQRLVSTSHRPVDANRVAPTWRSYCFPGSAGGSLHGCVDDRLGSARRGSHSLRHMASRDDETAHQLFGDGGRLQCSEGFSEVPDGQVSSPLHRQHYCGLLCQQGGGSHSPTLSREAESLLLLCQSNNIALKARHVAGKINILADFLSRPGMILQTEWTLAHSVLQPVWAHWHKPMIDLFATQFSSRLPIYVSPVRDPRALETDALSISWVGMSAYAFPPFPILSKVIRKARTDNPCLILIAPMWPAQPWFPELLELVHLPPLKLNVEKRGLLQPRSGIPHPNPAKLCLHAWLVCGKGCGH